MQIDFDPEMMCIDIPCKHGHGNIRYKNGYKCVVCVREYNRRKYLRDPEADKARATQWIRNHPGFMRPYNAARAIRETQAIPKWANLTKIRIFYALCPEGMEVDHIVPLRSNLVCGLHWEQNLQYLTKSDNCFKGNRQWPDMP